MPKVERKAKRAWTRGNEVVKRSSENSTSRQLAADKDMDDRKPKPSVQKPLSAAERRQLRLEQQLRGNLQKRKAQARSRRANEAETGDADAGDADAGDAEAAGDAAEPALLPPARVSD